MIKEFLSHLRDQNIDISLSGENLDINFDEEIPVEILHEIKEKKSEILTF